MLEAAFLQVPGFGEQCRERLRGAERVFVLGIGMDWKSDDRAGSSLARALARIVPDLAAVRVVDGGEAPENFTGTVRAFAPSHVLLLDAVDHGEEPGTVFLADEAAIVVGDMTSHHLPLKLLMRYLEGGIPCRVILVGIQPKTLLPGRRLSTPLRRTVAPLAAFLAAALRQALREAPKA